jgi:hypothetical protein
MSGRSRSLPTNESTFYQRLRDDTLSSMFWERLELKTDSGFPDAAFFLKKYPMVMGHIELKFHKTVLPNLDVLMKPSQKANFIEYVEAGGRNRYVLCCSSTGVVRLYTGRAAVGNLRSITQEWSSSADLDDLLFPARVWLPSMLQLYSGITVE